MNSSPTIAIIAAALVKAQSEMGNAKKDAVNPFFKKTYADINSVREAVLPSLNKFGITIIQPLTVADGVSYVETVMLHESGEYISSLTQVITDKPGDAQRHGSGISYARRYALQSIVNIGAEDDDANGATGKEAKTNLSTDKDREMKAWGPTTKQVKEYESLLAGSTLDDNGKKTAHISMTSTKSQAEWDKLTTRLRQLQTVTP